MAYPTWRAQRVACGAILLTALLLIAVTHTAQAGELTKIERKIRKEPEYSAPFQEYCLLVFGAAAKTQVWVVRDGKDAYVDTNANGDLTEPGEKRANVYRPTVPEQGNTRLNLRIDPESAEPGLKAQIIAWDHNREGHWNVHMRSRERSTFTTDPVITARSFKEAPIVHLDGPLTVVAHSYSDDEVAQLNALKHEGFKRGETYSFPLMSGNRGRGQGANVVHESETLLKLLHGSVVTGRFEFTGQDGLPIIITQTWTFSKKDDP